MDDMTSRRCDLRKDASCKIISTLGVIIRAYIFSILVCAIFFKRAVDRAHTTLDDLASIFTGSRLPPGAQFDVRESEEQEEELPEVDLKPSAKVPDLATSTSAVSQPCCSPVSDHARDYRNQLSSASFAKFTIEQMGVDRRLLVNRKRQLKMYRVWMQAKFLKV